MVISNKLSFSMRKRWDSRWKGNLIWIFLLNKKWKEVRTLSSDKGGPGSHLKFCNTLWVQEEEEVNVDVYFFAITNLYAKFLLATLMCVLSLGSAKCMYSHFIYAFHLTRERLKLNWKGSSFSILSIVWKGFGLFRKSL